MSFSVDMERGNQRQSLSLRILVLEVPALKIGARLSSTAEKSHNLSPRIQFPLNLGFYIGLLSTRRKPIFAQNIDSISH